MGEKQNMEELERINKEIELELERGIVEDDEEIADEVSNRHVNFLTVIVILFVIAIAINVGFVLFRLLRVLF